MTTAQSEQQRLIEFRVGDRVKYEVMANTFGVVTAICRRKFMTRSALRINDLLDRNWNWVGQQLVRVRCVSGFKGIEDHWYESNRFTLVTDQIEGA